MNKFNVEDSLGSKSEGEIAQYLADIDDDFPTVGLTGYDVWFAQLLCVMVVEGFLDVTEMVGNTIDRDAFKDYYDSKYTPQEAFEEELTYYGD